MNAAGSRVVWTIAKDGGFPCSNYFAQLSPRFNVPVRASLAFIAMNLAVGESCNSLFYLVPRLTQSRSPRTRQRSCLLGHHFRGRRCIPGGI